MTDLAPTELTPLTQERIEAQLDAFGLKHFRGDDGLTRTAFPGLVCFFNIEPEGFQVTTRWLGTAQSVEDAATMRLFANELNRRMPLVRTRRHTREDGTAIVLFEGAFFTDPGVADSQLAGMLEFYFSAIHHMAEEFRGALPHLDDTLPAPESPAPESEA